MTGLFLNISRKSGPILGPEILTICMTITKKKPTRSPRNRPPVAESRFEHLLEKADLRLPLTRPEKQILQKCIDRFERVYAKLSEEQKISNVYTNWGYQCSWIEMHIGLTQEPKSSASLRVLWHLINRKVI